MRGTYDIIGRLGAGGRSVVYKAWHTRLNKHVVIKEDKLSYTSHTVHARSEAEALKNIRSMYVPQVFDILTECNRSFTVIEFVEGLSFDKLLSGNPGFTKSQLVKWYWQLASALESTHKRGVCHRDIKPSNIMLTPEGDVYLIDFNSALVGESNTGLICRSPGYASPEQHELYLGFQKCSLQQNSRDEPPAAGVSGSSCDTELLGYDCVTDFVSTPLSALEPSPLSALEPSPLSALRVDWKLSDIYSLGATMFHFLTGKRPSLQTADSIPNLSKWQPCDGPESIIWRSMRRDPLQRYASAKELAEAILTIYPAFCKV